MEGMEVEGAIENRQLVGFRNPLFFWIPTAQHGFSSRWAPLSDCEWSKIGNHWDFTSVHFFPLLFLSLSFISLSLSYFKPKLTWDGST